MLEVTDDSGFLALIDPDAYRGYVGEDWELAELVARFQAAMAEKALLLWGTGLEGFWRVEVATEASPARAVREITGPIVSSSGRLLVTNYESLTMAAQAREVVLPQPHEEDQLIALPPGTYNCRILQLFEPDEESFADGDGPDFVIEILAGDPPLAPWSGIPWQDDL